MATEAEAAAQTAPTSVEDVMARGRASLLNFSATAVEASGLATEGETGDETPPDLSHIPEPVPPEEPEKTETEPEPEAEVEAKAEEPTKVELSPAIQEAIDKRIAKEVFKTKSERERADSLEAKIKDLESRVSAPTASRSDKPLQNVLSQEQLRQEETRAESARDYAESLMDRLDVRPDAVERELRAQKVVSQNADGVEEWTEEAMRSTLRGISRNANKVLREVPRREQYINTVVASQQQAIQLVPDLANVESERYQRFQGIVNSVPGLKELPNWPTHGAVYLMGLESFEANQAATKKPALAAAAVHPAKQPPKLAGSKSMPAATQGKSKPVVREELVQKLYSGNIGREDRVNIIQSMLDAKAI